MKCELLGKGSFKDGGDCPPDEMEVLAWNDEILNDEGVSVWLEYPHLLKGQLNDTLENKGLAENFFP